MDPLRQQQFDHLTSAKTQILAWAEERGVRLVRVEFIVPFVESAFYMTVWMFYESNTDAGWAEPLRDEFLRLLANGGYPHEWLSQVAFAFDSHENVVRDYEGNYFHRLR